MLRFWVLVLRYCVQNGLRSSSDAEICYSAAEILSSGAEVLNSVAEILGPGTEMLSSGAGS